MKTRKVESVETMMKKLNKERAKDKKEHPIKYYSERLYYKTVNFLELIPLNVKTFIQRGKRGYGISDVWSLNYYLPDVIEHSVRDLKKNFNGHPCDLTEGQWVDILNAISYTFSLVKECSEGDLCLIRDKKDRGKFDKTFKDKVDYRYMTPKEIKEYDLGWKYFKEYIFGLWD